MYSGPPSDVNVSGMPKLAEQGDEVVSSTLSIEHMEPVAELIYHQAEVVSLHGKVVGAEVLESVPGVYGSDWWLW
jgi:hypothetical protein